MLCLKCVKFMIKLFSKKLGRENVAKSFQLPTSTLAGIAKLKCTSGVKVAFTLFLLTLGDEARLSTQALLLD